MEIRIKQKEIYGIINPKINLNLRTDFEIKDVKVYANDKLFCDKNNGLIKIYYNALDLHLEFPKNTQKIEIILCSEDEQKIIINTKYSYLKRSLKVITKPFRVICDIIKRIFKPIFKAIRIMWTRHHFIIPPKKLKKYLKSFYNNYKYPENSSYYDPGIVREYNKWLNENKYEISNKKEFIYRPLISIIIPTYNVSRKILTECINSVLNQTYTNFEICIADDNSTNEETINTLKEYENNDKIHIVYRKENGMISKCMNSALEIAQGDYVGFLDNDDMLDENALYYMVSKLNKNKSLDLIYSDEDKMDEDGKYSDPNFKPDWSPDTLLSMNYICHFTIIRKSLLDKVGYFKSEYDGAQDYDLFLRVTEKTDKVGHVSKILYHWRKSATSTAANNDNKDYALLAGKKALEDAMKRRNIKADVLLADKISSYIMQYKYEKEPKISIVIPTKDHKDILEKCIESIYEKTTYKNFEVIVIDNNTTDKDALEYIEKIKSYKNLKVFVDKGEFNYSKINNDAIKTLKTDYILLLNNDTEVITPNWLQIMVGYASQKHIGCVGVKLLYPDLTIQHAGVILGLGGVASHAYIGAERDEKGYQGRLCVPYDYSAVTAACLMISKEKFDEVGCLEEDLKVAYNDVDLNIKILKKGYYNVFLPQVELIHYESKSRGLDIKGEKKIRFESEVKYMVDKWGNFVMKDSFYNHNFSLILNFMLDRRQ